MASPFNFCICSVHRILLDSLCFPLLPFAPLCFAFAPIRTDGGDTPCLPCGDDRRGTEEGSMQHLLGVCDFEVPTKPRAECRLPKADGTGGNRRQILYVRWVLQYCRRSPKRARKTARVSARGAKFVQSRKRTSAALILTVRRMTKGRLLWQAPDFCAFLPLFRRMESVNCWILDGVCGEAVV